MWRSRNLDMVGIGCGRRKSGVMAWGDGCVSVAGDTCERGSHEQVYIGE